eukprot:6916827-Pyramimonas_sp.AAC.1
MSDSALRVLLRMKSDRSSRSPPPPAARLRVLVVVACVLQIDWFGKVAAYVGVGGIVGVAWI